MLYAGFMLIGSDVKLNSPSSLIGQALTEILQHPERVRDALRVLLHLVRGSGTLHSTRAGSAMQEGESKGFLTSGREQVERTS